MKDAPTAGEPEGSSECPICFDDTPHEHSGLEIHQYRQKHIDTYNAQAEARRQLQDQCRAERAAKIKRLQDYETLYPCDFCRDLWHGSGNGKQYGLLFDGNTIKCPKCNQCLWSGER